MTHTAPCPLSNADAFNDITTGTGGGCSPTAGFPAVAGWDAVTGVGTPNYEKLAAAVRKLA